MPRYTALACLILATACADKTPLQPDLASRRTVTATSTVTLRAQTSGPNGEIWMISGERTQCLSDAYIISFTGAQAIVKWYEYCAEATFSDGGLGEVYNGGVANAFVQSDSGYVSIGSVPADMSEEGQAIDVPAGAKVKLQAWPNPGCAFVHWRTGTGTLTANPVLVTSGVVVANFHCY
jgi:hypothetical protein